MAESLKLIIRADLKKANADLLAFKKKVNGTDVQIGSNSRVRGVRNEIDKTTKSVGLLNGSLLDSIAKFSKWYLIGNLISQVGKTIGEVGNNVVTFDDALTKMSFTIDKSNDELNDMIDSTIQFAQELGSTGKAAIEATKIFTNMNASIEDILASSKDSVILNNLSGIGITASSDALQALTNQFRLTDEESSHLVDSLTFISSNLAVDFSRGIQEISAGIKNSGQTARDAGLSVNEYMSLLGKSVESSRKSGSTLSSGIRTIISRIRRVTQDGGDDLSKLDAAYKKIGINIRKNDTEFKDFGEILSELSDKTKELTAANKETTLSAISFLSAGTRQQDTFRTLVDVWDDASNLAKEAGDNIGFATEKNELFIKSIAGQKNLMISTFEEFSRSILSPDFFKEFYSGSTKVIRGLININDSVGLLNASLIVLIPTLIALKGATIALKIGSLATSLLALNPILLGLTVVGIAYVGVMASMHAKQLELNKSLKETTENLSETNKKFLETKTSIERFETLGKKVNKTKEETDEFNAIQEKLNKTMPEVKDKIDNQNISLDEQIGLYNKLNKELKDDAINKAQENLDKFSGKYEKNTKAINNNEETVKNLKKSIIENKKELDGMTLSNRKDELSYTRLNTSIKRAEKSIIDLGNKNKEMITQNALLKKSKDLLTVANSHLVFSANERIDTYEYEIGKLEDLSGKNKNQLANMLDQEKNLTKGVIAEIRKRIKTREIELLPTNLTGTTGLENAFKDDPVMNNLKAKLKLIKDIDSSHYNKIKSAIVGDGGDGGGSTSSNQLSAQQLALNKINRELELANEQYSHKTVIEGKLAATQQDVIDKYNEKLVALHNLNIANKEALKNTKLSTDERDALNEAISNTSKEYFATIDAMNDYTKSIDETAKKAIDKQKEINAELEKSKDDYLSKVISTYKDEIDSEVSALKDSLKEKTDAIDKQLKDLQRLYDKNERDIAKKDINKDLQDLATERLQQLKIGTLDANQRVYEIDQKTKDLQRQLAENARKDKYEIDKNALEDKKSSLTEEEQAEEKSLNKRLETLQDFQKDKIDLEDTSMQSILDLLKGYDDSFATDGESKGKKWADAFNKNLEEAMNKAGIKATDTKPANVEPVNVEPEKETTPKMYAKDGKTEIIRVKDRITGYSGTIAKATFDSNQDRFEKLKTGGVVSGTGLVQLDGTKPRPELVLNSDAINRIGSNLGLSGSTTNVAEGILSMGNQNIPNISSNSNTSTNDNSVTFGDIIVQGGSQANGNKIGKEIARTALSELNALGKRL